MRKISLISVLILLLLFSLSLPVFAYQPTDISNNHWALPYIDQLLEEDIMYTYEKGEFKPNQPITRGEFAYSLGKALELRPAIIEQLTDIKDHFARGYISALVQEDIINGYPDGTFRPEKEISRAEIITMLARSLNLNDEQKRINYEQDYYPDVDSDHWANYPITIGTRLNILDGYPDNTFKPDNPITRAESAKLLVEIKNIKPVEGEVFETYPQSQKVKLQVDNQIKTYDLTPNSLIGRNSYKAGLEDMLTSDQAYLLVNKRGKATYLKGYGLITQEEAAQQVSELTGEFLNPDELIQIAEGNWEIVPPKLKEEISNNLKEEGLTEKEIESLFEQDWAEMQELSRARLIEAVSLRTNIPKSVINSAIDQDWSQAREKAQNEAINSALKRLITNGNGLFN